VIVVEHNMFFVAHADYVVDLGPGSGDEGGRVVAEGTPVEVSKNERSVTAGFLKRLLS